MHTSRIDAAIEAAFLKLLLDLVDISDSFDQLAKLARIGDLLYLPGDASHKQLFQGLEKTALHLRGAGNIGKAEIKQGTEIPGNFYFGNFSNK